MKRPLAVLVVLALAFVGCSDSGDDASDSAEGATTTVGEPWAPQSGLPLTEPSQVVADGTGNVAVTLDMATRTIDVSGDTLEATPYMATTGSGTQLPAQINGPTIHVSPRGTITVTIINNLGDEQLTNIHYHGLHVSPNDASDNVFRDMAPSKTKQYVSIVNLFDEKTDTPHPMGTYWYHVHHHGNSAPQVNGGLSGMLIVDGSENSLVPPFTGTQRQFALREITTNGKVAQPGGTETRLVNGLYQPATSIGQNEQQLWRIVNIGVNQFYYVELEGHTFTIVAQDGNTLFDGETFPSTRLALPPGKRFDVLVTGGAPRSTPYALRSFDSDPALDSSTSTNPPITLATVTVPASTSNTPEAAPAEVTIDAPDDGLRSSRTDLAPGPNRRFVFERVAAGSPATTTSSTVLASDTVGVCPEPAGAPPPDWNWGINGELFEHDKTNVTVVLDTSETWTLCNTSNAAHPFHIHVNEFEVTQVNGKPYDGPPGYQDVVIIPAAYMDTTQNKMVSGQVVLQNIYRDFPGWFVFHCHILVHEDDGMMQSIQVLGPPPNDIPGPPPIKTD